MPAKFLDLACLSPLTDFATQNNKFVLKTHRQLCNWPIRYKIYSGCRF